MQLPHKIPTLAVATFSMACQSAWTLHDNSISVASLKAVVIIGAKIDIIFGHIAYKMPLAPNFLIIKFSGY